MVPAVFGRENVEETLAVVEGVVEKLKAGVEPVVVAIPGFGNAIAEKLNAGAVDDEPTEVALVTAGKFPGKLNPPDAAVVVAVVAFPERLNKGADDVVDTGADVF